MNATYVNQRSLCMVTLLQYVSFFYSEYANLPALCSILSIYYAALNSPYTVSMI